MNFTKEEISLCKQVAEKYRKEIKYGDWTLNEGGFVKVWPYRHNCKRIELITLWTISDCLEFLRERNLEFTLNYFNHVRFWQIQLWNKSSTQAIYSDYGKENKNKTPLEACLKAVLAVLGEGK